MDSVARQPECDGAAIAAGLRHTTMSPPSSEPCRLCSRCGGVVEVMTLMVRTAAGRTMPSKIGACVRCAQWFNEAGLGELARAAPARADE